MSTPNETPADQAPDPQTELKESIQLAVDKHCDPALVAIANGLLYIADQLERLTNATDSVADQLQGLIP